MKIVFAGDEENGHRLSTAEAEIRKVCEGCEAAFNFETGFLDDGLVIGRKGSCRVTLHTTGVASHAGNDPERGRNAILEMAHKTIEIQRLHDFEHGLFVNVGVKGANNHSMEEYAVVDTLFERAKLALASIITL